MRLNSMSTSVNTSVPPAAVTLTLTPSGQVPSGVSPFYSSTCDATCGTGTGAVMLDGALAGGFTYVPNSLNQTYLSVPPGIGLQHTLQITYSGDATHPPQSSSVLAFTVIANSLATPTFTISFDPTAIPQGESASITVVGSCGSQCSGANLLVDGSFAGGLIFDETGTAGNQTDSALSVGTHTVAIQYFGNATTSNVRTADQSFTVAPLQLPAPQITITQQDPQQIPSDEYGNFTFQLSCGANCRGGQFFVDNNFAGGYYPDSTGTASIVTYPGLTSSSHQLIVTYPGDANFRPYTSPAVSFQVVDDHLPKPVVTATPSQNPAPAGQYSLLGISVTSTTATSPCGGKGVVFTDGNYSGSFFPDSSGNGQAYVGPTSAGANHTVVVNYYGTGVCAPNSFTMNVPSQ